MKKRGEPVHGWVVLDKPLGMTSTQAVGKVRWAFNADKAGHGGTLDPLATGLLPIALGEATKTVPWAMDGRKIYEFHVRWGAETTTDDLEGSQTATSDQRPTQTDIASILHHFIGDIQQVPPQFSAIKIDGERAYDMARAGETVTIASRTVSIENLKLIACPAQDLAIFEVTCGKGTYVRSLARDMGRMLGCFGHVVVLRRIAVGPFTEVHMISLEMLEELRHKPPGDNAKLKALQAIETVLDGIPVLAVMELQANRLRQGQKVLLRGSEVPVSCDAVLMMCGSKPLGIGMVAQGELSPKRLFNL
jgi:tRNA pseudouridine55 synthase